MRFSRKYMLIAGAVCVGLIACTAGAVHLTSTTTFCLSCHEMRVYQEEQAYSPHAKDADGKEIGCSQCHIPAGNIFRMLMGKSWMGVRDVVFHLQGEGENLERLALQPVARRFTDDANCRKCHQDMKLNARKDGPISIEGSLAHDNYLGKNGKSRSGCVGCHQNLAHLPEFDARIPSNSEFAAKLKESKQ